MPSTALKLLKNLIYRGVLGIGKSNSDLKFARVHLTFKSKMAAFDLCRGTAKDIETCFTVHVLGFTVRVLG